MTGITLNGFHCICELTLHFVLIWDRFWQKWRLKSWSAGLWCHAVIATFCHGNNCLTLLSPRLLRSMM